MRTLQPLGDEEAPPTGGGMRKLHPLGEMRKLTHWEDEEAPPIEGEEAPPTGGDEESLLFSGSRG